MEVSNEKTNTRGMAGLFEQQTASQLSVAEFCKKHCIGQSYFYKRKSDLTVKNDESASSSFIKLKPQQKNIPPVSSIKIQHRQTRLILPATISAIWLADFVKALA